MLKKNCSVNYYVQKQLYVLAGLNSLPSRLLTFIKLLEFYLIIDTLLFSDKKKAEM